MLDEVQRLRARERRGARWSRGEPAPALAQELEASGALTRRLQRNIAQAVQIRAETLANLLVALLAEGHVLVEDYPGVGKTALARALARSIDCQFARIQCTPDLLPADVVGTNVYDQREHRFEFRPGPVFANVVLVDEINRASPKTQSGLLECMQERSVTVDVYTHELARPFIVLATQNPIEYEGTYPLPEAQVDRFMVRISLGYPEPAEEASMLHQHEAATRSRRSSRSWAPPTCSGPRMRRPACARRDALRDYVVRLLWRTREDPRVDLGASPRAGLMLLRAAKARAMMQGRDHALPDDVQALAEPVLAHRLVLAPGVPARDGARRGHGRDHGGEGAVSRVGSARLLAGSRRRGARRRRCRTSVALALGPAPLFVLGVGLLLVGLARAGMDLAVAPGARGDAGSVRGTGGRGRAARGDPGASRRVARLPSGEVQTRWRASACRIPRGRRAANQGGGPLRAARAEDAAAAGAGGAGSTRPQRALPVSSQPEQEATRAATDRAGAVAWSSGGSSHDRASEPLERSSRRG